MPGDEKKEIRTSTNVRDRDVALCDTWRVPVHVRSKDSSDIVILFMQLTVMGIVVKFSNSERRNNLGGSRGVESITLGGNVKALVCVLITLGGNVKVLACVSMILGGNAGALVCNVEPDIKEGVQLVTEFCL